MFTVFFVLRYVDSNVNVRRASKMNAVDSTRTPVSTVNKASIEK